MSGHREILPQQHNKRRGKGGMSRRISKACLPGKNLEIAPNMESREAFIRTNISSFMPYTPRRRGRNATGTHDHETRAQVLPILSPEGTEGMDISQPLGYLVSEMIPCVCCTFSISCISTFGCREVEISLARGLFSLLRGLHLIHSMMLRPYILKEEK